MSKFKQHLNSKPKRESSSQPPSLSHPPQMSAPPSILKRPESKSRLSKVRFAENVKNGTEVKPEQ